MKKLRIGLLTHNYPTKQTESKDAGRFVYAFAHALSRKAKPYVFCPDYGGEKEIDLKVPVTWFDWGGGNEKFGNWKMYSPLSAVKFIKLTSTGCKEVLKFVNDNDIDYLISFWNFPSGVFGLYAKKKFGIHYSTWALGSDIYIYPKLPIVRQIVKRVLRNADIAFGNSYDIGRAIKKLSGAKSTFLPTSNLIENKKYKKPKLDKKKTNFLYLARLEKVKGPDVLIEAAGVLSTKTTNFTVTFIGSGSMSSELKDQIRRLHLEKIVKILGYIEDQQTVNGFIIESDCLVIPSRSESFPLVVTEALLPSLPMIGSNVGDMPEFVGKNNIGYIFPKENSRALAKVMLKMIKNAKKMKRSNKKKMHKLAEDFRLDRIVDKFLSSVEPFVSE